MNMPFLKSSSRSALALVVLFSALSATSLAKADGPSDVKRLVGTWVVSRVLAMGPVTALTSAESKAMIGRKITYNASSFECGNISFAIKGYTRKALTDEEFLNQNRLPLAKIGTASSHVIELSAEGTDRNIADEFGAWVYCVRSDRIVVAFKGVYFELNRVIKRK